MGLRHGFEGVTDNVTVIDGEDDEHESTFFFGNGTAASRDKPEESSGDDHHDDVEHFEAFGSDAAKDGDG